MQRAIPRRLALAGLVVLAATGTACHPDPGPSPAAVRAQFIVRNDGFYDANVYVALSDGRTGWRLGTVTGNSATVFQLRQSDLQPGDVLMVRVHPIGTRVDWLSPAVIVGPDETPELHLIADARGALNMSSFYTRVRLQLSRHRIDRAADALSDEKVLREFPGTAPRVSVGRSRSGRP